ncbi:MAG TPA: 4'-phosphopantetheinyl transferase superfamily protein [Gemmatimonadales bacterium]|nr:4'-phosphopantetheinyl transferase superfamily protein [Gemmatimonadales bacterium]
MSEIDVFAFALDVPDWSRLESLLDTEERERATRFRFERDRRRYVVGRARLRAIIGADIGRDPRSIEFSYGSHGKPLIKHQHARTRIDFNLTRSHELGLVAIQRDAEVGIDVEQLRPFPECLDIAQRFFSPAEYDRLSALRPFEVEEAFFTLWTQKEAVVKSLGLGLSHPMDVSSDRWVTTLPPPAQNYVAAVASNVPPVAIRQRNWAP